MCKFRTPSDFKIVLNFFIIVSTVSSFEHVKHKYLHNTTNCLSLNVIRVGLVADTTPLHRRTSAVFCFSCSLIIVCNSLKYLFSGVFGWCNLRCPHFYSVISLFCSFFFVFFLVPCCENYCQTYKKTITF